MNNFLSRILSRTWAQILLAFLVGVALSFVPADAQYFKAFHHIGIGLLVAAIVTLFWHMREFTEFFEKFARQILIEDEYLSRLSPATLTAIRSRAGREIIKSKVDNDNYDHDDLDNWIDDILYKKLLPSESVSGVYRENFNDRIYVEYESLRDALSEVGSPISEIPVPELQSPVKKITTITWYRVIAPRKSERPYTVSAQGRFADMPNFPMEKRVAFFAGHSEMLAQPVDVKINDRSLGGIDFASDPLDLNIVDGECTVWTRTIEYHSLSAEDFVLNTMHILTRGLDVELYLTGLKSSTVIDGGLIAIGTGDSITNLPSGIHLKYSGWFFPDNGYCIWWW
jgi:hypothetical protein